MLDRAPVTEQMQILRAVCDQPVRNMRTMAVGGIAFGAHDAGELRMAAGDRKSAHVHEGADVRFLENADQLGGAARAVTDGEDQAAFAAF